MSRYGHRLVLVMLAVMLAACASPWRDKPALREEEWVSFDGKVLPFQAWSAKQPKMVVIAVHGLSGASSDFWLLGARLPAQGCAVYAYDLRGQGRDPSVRNRGKIGSAWQWWRDLKTFHQLVRQRHPDVPIFWYGESLGSLICLHAAVRMEIANGDLAGIVLASPIAGLRQPVDAWQRRLIDGASLLTPSLTLSLGELAGVDESEFQVTSTTTHAGQMMQTEHHVSRFSVRLLSEIGRMIQTNAEVAGRVRVPMLFLASPNDLIATPDQVKRLFSQSGSPRKHLLWYTRSYHLLLHDRQREEVVKDLTKWLLAEANQSSVKRDGF
jgi:acylglycerol lipase